MYETEYALDTTVTATLDANGAGTAYIGPTYPGERWEITLFSAKGPAGAKLEIFRGHSSSKLDGTGRADNDTSNTDIKVASNSQLRFEWSAGTAGLIMTCSVQGSRFVPGRRAY